eukprot:scaffold38168_cov66-Phaeocystis_antarctica.AAC.2
MVKRLVQRLAVVDGVAVALEGHGVDHLQSYQGGMETFAQCTTQRSAAQRQQQEVCRRQAGSGRRCAGCLIVTYHRSYSAVASKVPNATAVVTTGNGLDGASNDR